MKEHFFISLLSLTIIWLVLPGIVESQRNIDPCTLFPNGAKLRHPDDCSQEIICFNFKSSPGLKCSGSTPFYNKDTNTCVKHLTDHSTCQIDCDNKNGTFVQDHKSCDGYYYCQDDLALYSHCPQGYHFNETLQMCIYTSNSLCSINTFNFCAIAKSGIKFKYQSNCGKYYVCKGDKLVEEYCPKNNIYYNASKGECVDRPIDGCHPVMKDACKNQKNNLVTDGATCRGYFYCKNSKDENPQWYQCPDNTFFTADKGCINRLDAKCFYDRCEGSNKTFVVSSERGCRHYLYCKDGVKHGEGTCGNDFFDEESELCTTKIITHKACYYSK